MNASTIHNIYGRPTPHTVVRASAGSGKTYQLTSRYLRLIRHHVAPETILATTFTRKAAGEILARILGRIADAAVDGKERQNLAEAIGERTLSEDDVLAMLGRLVRSLPRLSISTIDSFFNRVAQGFEYELDLPAAYGGSGANGRQVTDEKHPLAVALRREAVEAMLADDDIETMLSLMRRLNHDQAVRSVTDAIDDVVHDFHEIYRRAPDGAIWSRLQAAVGPGLLEPVPLAQAVKTLRNMEPLIPCKKDGGRRKNWSISWFKTVRAASTRDWEAFLDVTLVKKIAAGESKYDYAEINDGWLASLQPLIDHALASRIDVIAKHTHAMWDLLRRFDGHHARLQRQHNLLLFSDITHALARRLPEMGAEMLDDLYFRLDGRIDHLLLDEFQDTSLDQWRVLHPISNELTSSSDGSRSFFCVGDVKQAIYGWRGGCAEIFHVVERLPGIDENSIETLTKSYRSSQIVLDAVNEVFKDVASNAVFEGNEVDRQAAAQWEEGFQEHEAAHALPGRVVLETSPFCADTSPFSSCKTRPSGPALNEESEDETDDDPSSTAHETFAAQRIEQLHRAAPQQTLGVLVVRKNTVNTMLYELRRLGLHVSGEAGNPLTDTPAVAAVLAALTLADHVGHSAAAFHVAHSPVGPVVGLDDAAPANVQRVGRAIRRDLVEHGYAAVLGRWVRRLAPSCGSGRMTRVNQLVELADQYEPLEGLRPMDFVRFVQVTPVEEPSPAPIRVMTIHRAKGLEFDIVVLPELNRDMSHRPKLFVDRDSPLSPIDGVYAYAAKEICGQVPAMQKAADDYRFEEREDNLCNLYVAMTRAKYALHMIVKPLTQKKGGDIGAAGWSNLTFASVLRRSLSTLKENESFDGAQVLYEHEQSDPDWFNHLPESDRLAGAAPGATGGLAAGADRLAGAAQPPVAPPAPHFRGRITPSALADDGRVRAADLLSLNAGRQRDRGTLIHAWFEHVGFVDQPDGVPDDQTLLAVAKRDMPGWDDAALCEALAEFHRMIEQPAIRSAMSAPAAHVDLWRERPFAVPVEDRLLYGRFDRVLIKRASVDSPPTAAVLIDFKTDRVDHETALQFAVTRYRPQIEAYRQALAVMLELPLDAILAELLFLHVGRVIATDA